MLDESTVKPKGDRDQHMLWHEGWRYRCLSGCDCVMGDRSHMVSHVRGKHDVLVDVLLGVHLERFNVWDEHAYKGGPKS